MPSESTNTIGLWTCLHDGEIKALQSDLLERTLSFVIDAPFHWEFHGLPADTRFTLVGRGVRSTQAFTFEAWPGSVEPSREMPWAEAQEVRLQNARLGRLVSSNWADFATQIGTEEEYIVMSAELARDGASPVLRLGAMSYPNSNYRDIEVRAESFHFLVGIREMAVEEFVRFGDAYWEDWSKQAKEASPK